MRESQAITPGANEDGAEEFVLLAVQEELDVTQAEEVAAAAEGVNDEIKKPTGYSAKNTTVALSAVEILQDPSQRYAHKGGSSSAVGQRRAGARQELEESTAWGSRVTTKVKKDDIDF